MPAYNFMPQFSILVETGAKTMTIRKTDRGAKPGDIAFLYTGQRTKSCRLLGKGIITHVNQVKICRRANGTPYVTVITGSGKKTQFKAGWLDVLAHCEGFDCGEDFVRWFDRKYGLPFDGFLHVWGLVSQHSDNNERLDIATTLATGSVKGIIGPS